MAQPSGTRPHQPVQGGADGLELRHLRAFVAVAEDLNFARAAERLFVAQSTLSRQVAALERSLGCVLLRRSTREVALTPAGRALYERAAPILEGLGAAVAAARAVGGELAARIAQLGEPFEQLTYADVEELRAAAERHYALLPLVDGVEHQAVTAGGVPALVASPSAPSRRCLLLLHGGGFVTGSAYGFRSLAGSLALAAGGAVVTPDYRLAPEHRFPAALDDVDATLDWWCRQGRDHEDVVIVADTSAAMLAVSLLVRRRDQGLPLPGAAVLLTPWLDPSPAALDRLPDPPAPSGTRAGAALGLASYLGDVPVDDPLVNPMVADLTGLPPLLIQVANEDEGAPEAAPFAERARAHGVRVRDIGYPTAAQGFHMYSSFLPVAAEALADIAHFCDRIDQHRTAAASHRDSS